MRSVCLVNPTVILKRPVVEILQRLDGDIGLLCPKLLFRKPDSGVHYAVPAHARVYTYSVIQPPGASEWPIPVTPMFLVQLMRVLWRYAVVHMWTYFYLSSVCAFLGALLSRRRLILTMDTVPACSFSMGTFMDTAFRLYHRTLCPLFMRIPSRVTLYGESLVPCARSIGIPKKSIQVIPTGIEPTQFDGETEIDIRTEFSAGEKPIILFVGLLVPRKGVDILLKAAREVDAMFLVVGDGPGRREYERMRDEEGMSEKVIFTGRRRDMGRLYRGSDIFFLPSRGEGLAGVIMEAMAAGLPVVSSRIACTTDLVDDGKTGYLCGMEDAGCYAQRLSALAHDRERRVTMGTAGRRKIEGFTWEHVMERYKGLYG